MQKVQSYPVRVYLTKTQTAWLNSSTDSAGGTRRLTLLYRAPCMAEDAGPLSPSSHGNPQLLGSPWGGRAAPTASQDTVTHPPNPGREARRAFRESTVEGGLSLPSNPQTQVVFTGNHVFLIFTSFLSKAKMFIYYLYSFIIIF